MSDLRKRTIRLAHANPELRPHLLPLLRKTASDSMLEYVIPQREMLNLFNELEGVDDQSKDLAYEVYRALRKKLDLPRGEQEALNRLRMCVENAKRWDPALLRNNIFKAAHSLGMKLPSAMF